MKADIILSGVGGQGILSIAAVIGEAALKEGLYMKQAPLAIVMEAPMSIQVSIARKGGKAPNV